MTRPFRFGVVAPLRSDVPTWRDRVRRIADSGYSTLLVPDFPQLQPAPATLLATAAALTDLRVGSWVYASPFRPAWLTAWEAHSLTLLTEGRFEMGIGTGRPGIEAELRDKGIPDVPPPRERLTQIRETITRLRELDGPDRHTPVAMAVYGPKARALAAEVADTVTLVLGDQPRGEVERMTREFRSNNAIELALAVPVVGDTVAPHMAPPDTDTAALHAADAMTVLPDDPAAATEEIQRRREELGFSYFVFGADVAERFAPIVAELAGK
ncbi:probable F420-dependent oxidoreductase, MSMEG_2516 family [Nocardia otitidiscaviarum]|uniref:Probable F420-dependent oxidoreductase, MSMEG_2516 family n=1 Tax=Nocardia otitidiscaviarum TaxID=1823 RepID=A0A378YXV8_9NOCA|nr:LLM class flavin-dependent oxidoreductase [Nocardia otitidiscaviarum]SUA81279.1 probable F420-dependent oxidoreductase, MSMEG_2516 family [Nocardia otitidiscaviarum]